MGKFGLGIMPCSREKWDRCFVVLVFHDELKHLSKAETVCFKRYHFYHTGIWAHEAAIP